MQTPGLWCAETGRVTVVSSRWKPTIKEKVERMEEGEAGNGGLTIAMVDRMVEVAMGCDALSQALDCMRTAVRADPDGGLSFVDGMLDVLLFSAERVRLEAKALVEDIGQAEAR